MTVNYPGANPGIIGTRAFAITQGLEPTCIFIVRAGQPPADAVALGRVVGVGDGTLEIEEE